PALQASVLARSVMLRWPAVASNYVLETLNSLSGESSWTAVTNGFWTNAELIVFTNSTEADCGFYRLRQR
ncbi:MAG TPA: hypothetical protein VNZ22_12725, partial [Bacillota bacterium]|nr:hypothetical protein [Bacillota bacterium]